MWIKFMFKISLGYQLENRLKEPGKGKEQEWRQELIKEVAVVIWEKDEEDLRPSGPAERKWCFKDTSKEAPVVIQRELVGLAS